MTEMSAIAFAKFNGAKLSGKKDDYINGFNARMTAQPNMLTGGADAPPLAIGGPPAEAPKPVPAPLQPIYHLH